MPAVSRRSTRRAFLRAALACPAAACLAPTPAARREPTVRFVASIGGEGSGEGELFGPIAIACRKDELFVTEVHNARVSVFGTDGVFRRAFPLPHDGTNAYGPSAAAGGIAVDDDGCAYVSFMAGHEIVVFDAEGEIVRRFGERGAEPGQLDEPGGLALGADGKLYVADQVNRRVQVFTPEGELVRSFGEYGTEPGRFDGIEARNSRFGGPHYLAIDGRGELYTTEGALGRVQRLTRDGRPLAAWGEKTDEPGGFGAYENPFSKNTFGPIGVCVDREDRVWVSSLNGRVQLFTREGELVAGVGDVGSEPGEFVTPHAMVVDGGGFLHVVDSGNHRVQKLALE